MTEERPEYQADAGAVATDGPLVVRVTPTEGADLLMVYFMRRRDVLIAELREIDRLLGRPQTVPERTR